MNEGINILEKNIENFFNMKNYNIKNSKFKAYLYQGDESTNNIHIIYDNKSYLYLILNIPKNKEYIIKEKHEYEITITDSSYDLFFYKSSYNKNTINCILLFIINDIDIEITNENYLEFKEEKLININLQDTIINKIKEKISDFIKYNNEKKEDRVEDFDIQKILIGEKDYNFLFNRNLIEDKNNNIKLQIEKLKTIVSKVEIRNLNINNENNNLFMNVYEVLPPSYKSSLVQKYLSEMPINLYNLMEKYHKASINKISFNNYKNNKLLLNNKNINNNITNKDNSQLNINRGRQKKNKIKNKNIFKLKKSIKKKKKELKIIKKNRVFKKRYYFKINKDDNEYKEQNKIKDNILNKMLIEEPNKNINTKKNIFKCISSPTPKNNGIFFIVNKK